jgi:hypothetical protein
MEPQPIRYILKALYSERDVYGPNKPAPSSPASTERGTPMDAKQRHAKAMLNVLKSILYDFGNGEAEAKKQGWSGVEISVSTLRRARRVVEQIKKEQANGR